jgi:hypothetical protein
LEELGVPNSIDDVDTSEMNPLEIRDLFLKIEKKEVIMKSRRSELEKALEVKLVQ